MIGSNHVQFSVGCQIEKKHSVRSQIATGNKSVGRGGDHVCMRAFLVICATLASASGFNRVRKRFDLTLRVHRKNGEMAGAVICGEDPLPRSVDLHKGGSITARRDLADER